MDDQIPNWWEGPDAQYSEPRQARNTRIHTQAGPINQYFFNLLNANPSFISQKHFWNL
jgi:hypothetical protein